MTQQEGSHFATYQTPLTPSLVRQPVRSCLCSS